MSNIKIKTKKCEECNKPLKAIGLKRENGKTTHDDWESRKYHKKCWKELQNFNLFKLGL